MIDVSNVTISFEEENQTHVILDDVSLNIEKPLCLNAMWSWMSGGSLL